MVMTPFLQASRHSLAYQFTIIAPLLCPPFSNFRKFFHFQPCFGQNFSYQDANFRSLDPLFFKENPLPIPYFWKPVWHIPTKKKVECPPGVRTSKMFHFIHKNVSCVFSVKSDSPIAYHMTINQAIGMSHGKQEPMESGRYHDIIHRDIFHHDVIHFAFTKMADSQNYRQKYTRVLPSVYTFFGLIFQKLLTYIRNKIVLHAYFNLKCNKNWRKAAYHASSDSVSWGR